MLTVLLVLALLPSTAVAITIRALAEVTTNGVGSRAGAAEEATAGSEVATTGIGSRAGAAEAAEITGSTMYHYCTGIICGYEHRMSTAAAAAAFGSRAGILQC